MAILPKSLPDAQFEFFKEILQATANSNPDLAFRVYLQALEGGFSGVLGNYTETSETVTFTSGAASVDVSDTQNVLLMTLTENFAVTVTNPILDKTINLVITHTGGPWTLDWDSIDLELEGAAGDVEYVTMRYTGSEWHVYRAGVVNVTI